MRHVLATAAAVLLAGPVAAQVITLECPRRPMRNSPNLDAFLQARYQITLKPPSVYQSWKQTGGERPHDWKGENLVVESVTPYQIKAYSPAKRITDSYTLPRSDYDIDRTTLVVRSEYGGSEQCVLIKNPPTMKPKF